MPLADRGKQLLRAIYDDPADLDARRVYADWLQEQGDVRGELIMMQLDRRRSEAQLARERELVEEHGEKWQGKLGEITTWVEFEGGFLARCGLSSIPAWAIGRREWSTVKHIGISDDWAREAGNLVSHPVMRSLESLRVPARAAGFMTAVAVPRDFASS